MTSRWLRAAALGIASIAFTVQGPQPAHARYDERDAQRACERAVERNYGYGSIHGSQVSREGNHDYRVTGQVDMRGGRDKRYVCNIRHDEVVNVKLLDDTHHNGSHDNDGKVATAVGIGVLGLALAAAAASSGGDQSRAEPYRWQGNGGSPFDDHEQLKHACTHELERHLNSDHGRVERLSIRSAHLDGRDLKGDAHVSWRSGEEADLRFDCAFDRQGRIYDGTYHYTTSRSETRSPTGPYTTAQYDATTILPCSLGSPSHDRNCPAGVHRGNRGSASVRVQAPNGRERVLDFEDGDVSTPNGGRLTWGKEGDTWFIGIDDREFYVVPEAVVFGG